jgi:hypothetical protein
LAKIYQVDGINGLLGRIPLFGLLVNNDGIFAANFKLYEFVGNAEINVIALAEKN